MTQPARLLTTQLLSAFISLIAIAPASADPNPPTTQPLHHYVFFGMNRARIHDPKFADNKSFEGAQVRYAWKIIEHGEGQYDFSHIEDDVTFLASKGKKLFIQIQDISYDPSSVLVPRYLLKDPAYHGGVDKQYENSDGKTPEGLVARRWDPAVKDRFQQLLFALGKQFDGRIEGINFAETAIDIPASGPGCPEGFTPEIYRDAVIDNMRALKKAFPKSVAMVYANFMVGGPDGAEPGSYLRDLYRAAKDLKVAMGGPDLKPWRPGQMSNSYPLLRDIAGAVPTGIAVQDGNYSLKNPKTGKRVTLPELIDFATHYLHVNYLFWCTEEPYYSRDVIPYLQRQAQ